MTVTGGTLTGGWSPKADILIQTPASSFNPVGLIGPMVSVSRGISSALEADDNSDTIAVTNVAIPFDVDRTKTIEIRLGWSSAGIVGVVGWSMQYQYLSVGTDTTAAADGEIFVNATVPGVVNTYTFDSFILPAPGDGPRVIKIRLTRYGSTDSSINKAYVEGFVTSMSPA